MKILVVGATGPTGRQIVSQALARGHQVVAFVHDNDPELARQAGVTQSEGDVLDPVAVRYALEGCDAVLSALGSKPSLIEEVTLLSKGTQAIVDAMHAHAIKRLIAITGIGAGDSRGHGGFVYDNIVEPTILRQVYKDKDRQEDVIRASGLDWTIVRPAQLSNDPGKRQYRTYTDLTGVTAGTIARADVADFMLTELEDDKYLHQTPLITD